MIDIKDLSFSYGDRQVLKNVSFSIESGDRWAIIGRNGAGKSTLVRCIAGLEKPATGSAEIDSKPIHNFSPPELSRLVAYVPQLRDHNVPFSVYDYVMMGRFPYQGIFARATQNDRAIVENALEITDCVALKDRLMNQLSGGEQQRVLLAGAVSQQTKVLLLDEPTTFLDPLHQVQLEQALHRVHKQGDLTVVTVTHDINAALHYYDHILALVDGKPFFAGLTTNFLEKTPDILECIFGLGFKKGVMDSGQVFVMPQDTRSSS